MLTREKVESVQLAYAAAALDCEGSISVSYTRTKHGWPCTSVHISIANTNYKLVQLLQETFGGNIYAEEPKRLSKRVIYRWKLFSNEAAEFLRLVRPYMLLKTAQADLALNMQDSRKSRRLSAGEQETFWLRMKALNRGEPLAETKREDAEINLRSDSPILAETPVS